MDSLCQNRKKESYELKTSSISLYQNPSPWYLRILTLTCYEPHLLREYGTFSNFHSLDSRQQVFAEEEVLGLVIHMFVLVGELLCEAVQVVDRRAHLEVLALVLARAALVLVCQVECELLSTFSLHA